MHSSVWRYCTFQNSIFKIEVLHLKNISPYWKFLWSIFTLRVGISRGRREIFLISTSCLRPIAYKFPIPQSAIFFSPGLRSNIRSSSTNPPITSDKIKAQFPRSEYPSTKHNDESALFPTSRPLMPLWHCLVCYERWKESRK